MKRWQKILLGVTILEVCFVSVGVYHRGWVEGLLIVHGTYVGVAILLYGANLLADGLTS